MPEVWIPGAAEPSIEDFVERVQRLVERFAGEHGLTAAAVEVELELVDGATYQVASLTADPGFGFLTLVPHGEEPEQLIVPVGAVKRIAIGRAEERARLGFSLPSK